MLYEKKQKTTEGDRVAWRLAPPQFLSLRLKRPVESRPSPLHLHPLVWFSRVHRFQESGHRHPCDTGYVTIAYIRDKQGRAW